MQGYVAEQQILVTGALLILAAIASAAALQYTATVMIPFVLAILVSYLISPLVDFVQERLGAPRWLGILAAFVVIAGGATLLTVLLGASARGLADNADRYVTRIEILASQLQAQLDALPFELVPESWRSLDGARLSEADLQPILNLVGSTAGGLVQLLSTLAGNAVMVTLYSVYLVAGRKPYQERSGFWGDVDAKIRTYLVTKFAVSAATGIATWALLAMIGLELSLVFGVLAFLLNFIPSIGSIIAMLLPLPIALIQFDTADMVILTLALPGSAQFVFGNVVEPKMMGDSLDLHPITVLLALIFWGLLWGPVGMLLSTPIVAVLKIVLEQIETTRFLGELLGGRLPLLTEEPVVPSEVSPAVEVLQPHTAAVAEGVDPAPTTPTTPPSSGSAADPGTSTDGPPSTP